MKRILIVLLLVIFASACSPSGSNRANTTNKVDSLEEVELLSEIEVHAKIKDNAEYIPIRQYTSIEDFDPEDYIDIEINKDVDYEVKWVGQALSWRMDDYNELVSEKYKKRLADLELIHNVNIKSSTELTTLSEKTVENTKKTTLDAEGFRGITIYVLVNNGEEIVSYPVDTNLLVVPEELENVVFSLDERKIETAQRAIYEYYAKTYPGYTEAYDNYMMERFKGMPYVSNIG